MRVEPFPQPRVPGRLDELRDLENGWLDGKGIAPRHEGLDWLVQAFQMHFPGDLPPPFLYSTAEGGVHAEWSLGPNEITLEIDLGARRGDWHYLNAETGSDETSPVDLDATDGWGWLVGRIRQVAGVEA